MGKRNLTLMTDLYELTMMQGYYRNQNQNRLAVFDMFYRTNPFGGGYAIMAGLEQVIDYIRNLHFDAEDIDYLRETGHFSADFLTFLRDFRFTGSIHAVPEGSLIFPQEPIVKVTASILEAQILEPALLNMINHQSLIATKASRVCFAAGGDDVVEFGLRRAQGPDAGVYGARAAMIGGCAATSNLMTGKLFGVPVWGTHAHSWIMSFPDEYSAFRSFAELYPECCILLVDTYDTLKSGVPNAIRVFREMRDAGTPLVKYGIRLDSGDLAYLSKEARKMFNEAGFHDAIITASNDLDETLISSLKSQGAAINSWGVGTHMITAKDNPSLGGVYKLAAIMGDDGQMRPVIKISENTDKVTNPGDKKIIRIYDEDHMIRADLICLTDEPCSGKEDLKLFDPTEPWKKMTLPAGHYTIRELMQPIFVDGECVYQTRSVMEIRKACIQELNSLWEGTRRLYRPHPMFVDLSKKLYDLKMDLLYRGAGK